MSGYQGNYAAGAIIPVFWDSFDTVGASNTPATAGSIRVYKDVNLTESTAGVTDTRSFDGTVGIELAKIDTTADATFYAAGHDYTVILVGAVSDSRTINLICGSFSIQNRT